ncbi:DUF3110 domain-containing protein [Lyngbya confervoides]|uniref:DUF3110 domain-containing protein n=1 Tax=Lyngbya confervoides BDU141951 TaxID=1574623 RepID=A0ABD4T5V9_9CYAN|nr:DUF3110 domain-containing protein [Lyngbya confervoides]MCM1984092.1 DUF3110 domain-containing protein [Lyngbya confervoides BDU141951]
MILYVLLFNTGTSNEGIHTLKIKDPEHEQLEQDVVLAFEEEDDAMRFALLLEAQDFPSPSVEAISEAEITEFCRESGLRMQFIAKGTLAVPPEANLEKTDWQRDEARTSESELDRIRQQLERLL